MKLISLNVALFEANNSKLENFLKKEKPDIVCLQEVTRALSESVDQEYISKDDIDRGTINLKNSFFGPTNIFGQIDLKDFHGKEDFHFDTGGLLEMGNYTKSNLNLEKAQNIFACGNFTYNKDSSNWPGEQCRSITVTDFSKEGRKLRVINHHGIWTKDKMGNRGTLNACKQILKIAQEFEAGVIICGDFNLFPETPSIKVLSSKFGSLVDKFNISSTRPSTNEHNHKRNVVDYVFVNEKIKVINFKVINNDISDHLPLILDFDF